MKVLVSCDDDTVEAALEALPGAVVVDVDAPFDRAVEALLPTGVPSGGFDEQARRNAEERENFLAEHGALTAEEVAELAGSQAANRRQTAHRWRAAGTAFAVEHRDGLLFPAFQFDQTTGRLRPEIADVLSRLPDGLSGWVWALWWDKPRPVGGEWIRPIELLGDSERLAEAAETEAADWARDGAA